MNTQKKPLFKTAKIKELIGSTATQNALKDLVFVPQRILIKEVANPFKNKDTGDETQKIHAVSGSTFLDMIDLNFTLMNCSVDAKTAINKEFDILEYRFSLDANMYKGTFNGYSPTGLKLIVTKIAEVKAGN